MLILPLQAVLTRDAPSARQHCLHAYAAVGDFAGAEQVRSAYAEAAGS